jgi:tetratricopeptide (TPR) repeat protein
MRRRLLLAASLALLTLLAYRPALDAGFIWDDDVYVTDNTTLHDLQGLRRIWLELGAVPQYYPLVHTSYWLEHRLWGLAPAGYHLTNILLHLLGALLVWRLLVRLTVPGAWLAALIFALHPVHVESVAWITERKNVLSGVLYLAALWCLLRSDGDLEVYRGHTGGGAGRDTGRRAPGPAPAPARGATGGRSRRAYGLALLLFVAALLAKTVAATLPGAYLLIRWWKTGRLDRTDALRALPFVLIGAGFGALTAWMEVHHVGASGAGWALDLGDRLLVAGRALWFYAGKLVWPSPLVFIYPRWELDPGLWWQPALTVAAAAVPVALWLARHRIGRGPLTGVLFFAGTLVPALGFFDVYPFRFSFVADHFQYLASLGLIALAVAATARVIAHRAHDPRLRRALGLVLGTLVVAALGTATWQRAQVYADAETLWRDTLARNPSAWMAHNNLGAVLDQQGRTEEALEQYEAVLRQRPDDANALNNVGVALEKLGRLDAARERYLEALRIDPTNVRIGMNLANLMTVQGKTDQAINCYELVLKIDPAHVGAHGNLGRLLMQRGDDTGAVQHLRQALELDPSHAVSWLNLGIAHHQAGRFEAAVDAYRQAIACGGDTLLARYNLGVALEELGRPAEAALALRQVLARDPDHRSARELLDAILAPDGDTTP